MNTVNSFDYIVVGTGSSGSVLVNRLSESPANRVLALEAGVGTLPAMVHDPKAWPGYIGSSIDWGYTTVPQPGLANRSISQPRGKLIGGTSNLYAMFHVRGHLTDYDYWAYNGAPGWRYDDVRPYFDRIEQRQSEGDGIRSGHGSLPVVSAGTQHPHPASATFITACQELGFPYSDDFNGPQPIGVGWQHMNVKNGKRYSVVQAYLEPALLRPNVQLTARAQATRLLFDGRRCIGVEYWQDGQLRTAIAEREVVLAAGAVESPKLLLLSGIGNPQQLRPYGIELVADVPGVGENFHDHTQIPVVYATQGTGEDLSFGAAEASMYLKSDQGLTGPDLQLNFLPTTFEAAAEKRAPDAYTILVGVIRPVARGWVRLMSADPLAHPLLHPNMLGDKADLQRLVQGVQIARQIFAAQAFAGRIANERRPGPEATTVDVLEQVIRQQAVSYWHICGSCKMGRDDYAVVDPHLRVYGVECLRIADSSVMPQVTSGNPHVAALVIAERAAELMLRSYSPNEKAFSQAHPAAAQ